MSTLIDIPRLPLLIYLAAVLGISISGALDGNSAFESVTVIMLLGVSASVWGTVIREAALVSRWSILLPLGILGLAIVLDDLIANALFSGSLLALWRGILSGSNGIAFGTLALLVVLLTASAAIRAKSVRKGYVPGHEPVRRSHAWYAHLLSRGGPVTLALVVESLMLMRCRYPRYLLRGIGVMLALLAVLAVITPDSPYGLITTLFVVAGFAATYGQLVFGWNSDHFEGLFALPIDAEVHVVSRWILGALLAVVPTLGLLLAGLFFDLVDGLFPVAFFVVTVGCVMPLLILVSARTARRVRLDASGFSNIGAFSWQLYAMFFGLWIGTELLVLFTSEAATSDIFLVIGSISLLLVRPVARLLGSDLRSRMPAIAERLRAG